MCFFTQKEIFLSGMLTVVVDFFFLSRTSSNNLKMPGEQIDTWEVPKAEVMVKKNKLHSNPEEEIACEPN